MFGSARLAALHIGEGGLEEGVTAGGGELVGKLRIEACLASPVHRWDDDLHPVGLDLRRWPLQFKQFDLGTAQVEFDLAQRDCERLTGDSGQLGLRSRDPELEVRQALRVGGHRSPWPFFDVDDQDRAETCPKRFRDRLERSAGVFIVRRRPDEIGRPVDRDSTRDACGRFAGAVDEQEGQPAIEMGASMRSEGLSKRALRPEFGGERLRQRIYDALHRSSIVAAIFAVSAMKRRISVTSATFAAPVHSSM